MYILLASCTRIAGNRNCSARISTLLTLVIRFCSFSVLCLHLFFSYISGLCAVVLVPQELHEDIAHTEVEDSVKYSASRTSFCLCDLLSTNFMHKPFNMIML